MTTALLLALCMTARPAMAELTLRIARPLDLTALPLLVMQHDHLIERVAEAMGLGAVTVEWRAPDEARPALEALAARQTDIAVVDLAPLLAAADAADPASGEVRGLAALAQRPYVLVSRKNSVHTIRDFTAADRIAVPALKISGPAVALEMAAALEWGPEHYDKLDRLVVARADAAAAAALLSGKGEITAHFSRAPYSDDELDNEGVHRVMDSFDIAGPHSVVVLATTKKLRDASPMLCAAILSALQQADDFIRDHRGEAAEMYAGMVKEGDIPLEDLADMIGDPDLAYRAAPAGVMRLADFMHRVGRLKHRPEHWQDFFLPEARDLKGN